MQTIISNMRRLHITNFNSERFVSSNFANSVKPFEAIPGPRPLPLIGNIWRYLPIVGEYDIDNLYRNAQINRKKYGPIVREQITRNHIVLHLFDPNDIKAFFMQDSIEPYRRSHRALLRLRNEDPKRYNDGGIFPENGSSWSRLRRLFNQSLMSRNSVMKRAPILDAITKHQISSISSQELEISRSSVRVDNFEQFLYRWSVRCALATFLDFTNSSMPDDEFIDQIIGYSNDQLEALAGTEIKSDRWLKHPSKCPYYQKLIREEDFMYEFVSTRVNHLSKTNSLGKISFLRDWIEDERVDHKDIITFLIDSVLADIHTTVYTCMFLLEDISRRMKPGLKGQLLQQISDAFTPNSKNDSIEVDMGERIPLLKYCLKETLRLHPVSIGTGRLTQHEMIVSNYRVPKDVMIIAHNQVICRDSNIYKDPDDFEPLRWDESETPRSNRPSPFAWLPFGFGPRACIGQRLVSLQIYILAIRLLEKYQVEFCSEIKTKTNLVHQLDSQISVQLHSNKES